MQGSTAHHMLHAQHGTVWKKLEKHGTSLNKVEQFGINGNSLEPGAASWNKRNSLEQGRTDKVDKGEPPWNKVKEARTKWKARNNVEQAGTKWKSHVWL